MSKTTRKQRISSRSGFEDETAACAGPVGAARDHATVSATESPPAAEASGTADAPDDAASMSQLSIQFDGRNYRFGEYRYGKLGDAIAYARLMRPRNVNEDSRVAPANDSLVEPPAESQRQLMQQLSISFDDGVYKLGPFRYDKLADAVSYARICLRRYVAGRCEITDVLSPSDLETKGTVERIKS